MKSSKTQARNFRPTVSRIVTALAVASGMAAMAITPALAKDHDHRQGHHDNGWHKGEWKGDRDDDRRGYQEPYYYQHPYNYSQPVYAPPPVYYAPQQSPGISFFFPLDIHRR